ncbi:MAG: hypothetical protein ACE5EN_02590 [Nitrospinota bacterium]
MKSSEKERIVKSVSGRETELDNNDDNSTEGKISPLAIPLEKEPRPPEVSVAGEGQSQQSGAVKRISQKEFLDKVSARIDDKVEDAFKKRKAFPGTITILLILFLSPFIVKAGSDLYDLAKAKVTVPPTVVKPVIDKKDDLRAVLKKNEALVEKLANQNHTLSKKLTALIKVQEKIAKKKPDKIVVLPSGGPTTFSMKREKEILYEISGVDIDDPITEKSISKIKSAQILLAMVESFNRILINSDHSSVSDFHLKNTVKAKRFVVKKLRQLK